MHIELSTEQKTQGVYDERVVVDDQQLGFLRGGVGGHGGA